MKQESHTGSNPPHCSSLPVPFYRDEYVTIYHGDCRQILPLLERFDLLMADPPYGIGADKAMHKASGNVVGHGHRRVAKRTYEASDWDKEPVEEWVMGLARSLCDKQIIFGGNYYDLPPCKGPLVWDKQNDGNNFADAELAGTTWGVPCASSATSGTAWPARDWNRATTPRKSRWR